MTLGRIISDSQVIGFIELLDYNRVRVTIGRRVLLGSCVSDALNCSDNLDRRSPLRGYSDVTLKWSV